MAAEYGAELASCSTCPRLVAHREQVAEAYPEYFNAPVPAWGDGRARLLIIGLAPGLHGAARTGRAFVGDASGQLLFNALARTGFASSDRAEQSRLHNSRLTNAVKCLPPGNAPTGREVNACQSYLQAELEFFCPSRARRARCIVTLGGVAYQALQKALATPLRPFAHGQETLLTNGMLVIASYHPSRLNVNTGRINQAMLNAIFERAQQHLT